MYLLKKNYKKRTSTENEIKKTSIFNVFERLIFTGLVVSAVISIFYYASWWFEASHIPSNWKGILHFFDYLLFGTLSIVVFIGIFQRLGAWFALSFAAKPIYKAPEKGLRVAFLTCYVPGKEPLEMLVRTLKAMKKVKYRHDSWVLDEGNSKEVKKICKELGIFHFSRKGIAKYNKTKGSYREKTKAGNHNAWLDKYDHRYDLVAQIDMDHVPQSEYFVRTIGYFKDPRVGFVGMPQIYRNTNNWIARGAAEQSYFFHGPMQQGYYGSDMPFLIGTSHIYRTSAMKEVGGYGATIVEDHLTGMHFYANKWKGVFVPEILAKGEGPLNWVDYFNQQMRWSYGIFEIFFKYTPRLIQKLKWKQKINYFFAQLFYFTGVAVVLGLVLTILYLFAGISSSSMEISEWVKHSIPPLAFAILIQIYIHRFSIDPDNEPTFGFLGMFLALGANIIYTIAFFKFVTNRKLRYMVTQKGENAEKQRVPLKTFTPHLILAALAFLALVYSFITNHDAIQLRFWAFFNIAYLLLVSLSLYIVTISMYLESRKYLVNSLKYGFMILLTVTTLSGTAFAYIQREDIAYAIFSQGNTSVSGKVTVPKDGAYLGISVPSSRDMKSIYDLQKSTNKKFYIIGFYQSWGSEENKFNRDFANSISNNGSTPLITWEPWRPVGGFDRSESVVNQKEYRLTKIIAGDYDAYIRQYARDVRAYRKSIMIRFAHEMNGNWYPWGSTFNKPKDYVLAWRHVHEIFDSEGASNVTWVWSPNEVYFSPKVPNSGEISQFYPGDEYVDFVGFSSFNWANNYNQISWKTPFELFSDTVKQLRNINKPIIIAETASAESLSDTKNRAKWILALSDYVSRNKDIKGVVWFNAVDNGIDWRVSGSKSSEHAFKDGFGKYYFQNDQYSNIF